VSREQPYYWYMPRSAVVPSYFEGTCHAVTQPTPVPELFRIDSESPRQPRLTKASHGIGIKFSNLPGCSSTANASSGWGSISSYR